MLVDDVKVNIKAGKGGDGTVSFKRAKMELGPTGGNGGDGGNVYVKGVVDLGALKKFRFKKDIRAESGKRGLPDNRSGENGKDVLLEVPVGTVVHDLERDMIIAEVNRAGEEILIAKGGKGGRGNFQFRSSRNTSPKEFEYGKEGDLVSARFELKIIADIGFIGLPNVGKSSLLNELTNAETKVANYPFTTLEPSLGVYYELVIADIPGLIKGASFGKGLGIKFLRHIERTKVLFHFVSAQSAEPLRDYETVREELGRHCKKLLEKPEYLIVSKKDEVSRKRLFQIKEELEAIGKKVIFLSILEEESIRDVKIILNELIEDKKKG